MLRFATGPMGLTLRLVLGETKELCIGAGDQDLCFSLKLCSGGVDHLFIGGHNGHNVPYVRTHCPTTLARMSLSV